MKSKKKHVLLNLSVLLSIFISCGALSSDNANIDKINNKPINTRGNSMQYNEQEQAVIDTVNYYIAGVESKKDAKENIEKAFYSSTNLHSVGEDGKLKFLPRDALVQYVAGDMPETKGEILDVEVINDMALVKVRLILKEFDFFDYLTLLKLDSGWKIVSKTFTIIDK